MSTVFQVPKLGESVKTATVAKLLVSTGDKVAIGQPVVELETDKAAMEVPSDVAGTVQQLLVKTGDEVKPGQALFTVG